MCSRTTEPNPHPRLIARPHQSAGHAARQASVTEPPGHLPRSSLHRRDRKKLATCRAIREASLPGMVLTV
ncbi:hypothetical protein HMPREF9577_02235 [Cutibacterium acnes HL110PA3]|nr:hypothetical protein HMPREF9577_02235 [Cutibacterium acnes HL110PA3]